MTTSKNAHSQLSTKGNTIFFDRASASLPADQVFREVVKNGMDAIEKMRKIYPDYQGKITVAEDENLPGKLCVTDNGIGMPSLDMIDLVKNIAETHEQSEHGNYGIGAKIAAFASNKYGLLYTSKRHGEETAYRCRVYNDGAAYCVQYDPGCNDCKVPVATEELPSLIRASGHGTSLTLGGNSEDENTLVPPATYEESSLLKGSRLSKEYWLHAFLNTKFFHIPNYINLSTTRVSDGGKRTANQTIRVRGHKYHLDLLSRASGILKHPSAHIHWWIVEKGSQAGARGNDSRWGNSKHFTRGHLGILHNDEIISMQFEHNKQKNPLRRWGLDMSHNEVVVIIEPVGFEPDQSRTKLVKNNASVDTILPGLKEYFIEHMPEDIKKYEQELQDKFARKMQDPDVFAKKIHKWLDILSFKSPTGNQDMAPDPLLGQINTVKGDFKGHFNGGKNSVEPGTQPKSAIGNDPLFAGLKKKPSKDKGTRGNANPLPNVQFVAEEVQSDWVSYSWQTNRVSIRDDLPLIKTYAQRAYVRNRDKNITFHKSNTESVLGMICQNIISMVRYGSPQYTNLSEVQKKDLLEGDNVLYISLLNTEGITDAIVARSKNVVRQLAEQEKQVDEMVREDLMKHEAQLRQI